MSKQALHSIMPCSLAMFNLKIWKKLVSEKETNRTNLEYYEHMHAHTTMNPTRCILCALIYSPENWQNWLQNSLMGYGFCKENKKQLLYLYIFPVIKIHIEFLGFSLYVCKQILVGFLCTVTKISARHNGNRKPKASYLLLYWIYLKKVIFSGIKIQIF